MSEVWELDDDDDDDNMMVMMVMMMMMMMMTMTMTMMTMTLMEGGIQPSNADAVPSAATKEVMRMR